MIKQLYKRKTFIFLKMITAGIFASFLFGCAEEVEINEQKSIVAVVTTADEVVEQVEVVASDIKQEASSEEPAVSEEVSVAINEDAGFLNYDMVLGDVNAPVEIIEYASVTCNHCATFHTQVLPRIKEKYVDTGKVKVVMRSFLLNQVDANVSLITRCVPDRRYFKFMDAIFERQMQWYNIPEYQRLSSLHDQQTANSMFVDSIMVEVAKIAGQLGVNSKKIETCTANDAIGEYLYSIHMEGVQKHKVTATPTILVNGNKVNNNFASVERAIEAALGS